MPSISSGSIINSNKSSCFKKVLFILSRFVEVLNAFNKNAEKRLNCERLMNYLKLTRSEMDDIITFILNFQDQCGSIFSSLKLKKKIEDRKIYLVAERIYGAIQCPQTIHLSESQCKVLNDATYLFKFVKRGKGFPIDSDNGIIIKILRLREHHPYLFELKEGDLLYPSPFGLKLGESILSYNKSGRSMTEFTIDNHTIIVNNDGTSTK